MTMRVRVITSTVEKADFEINYCPGLYKLELSNNDGVYKKRNATFTTKVLQHFYNILKRRRFEKKLKSQNPSPPSHFLSPPSRPQLSLSLSRAPLSPSHSFSPPVSYVPDPPNPPEPDSPRDDVRGVDP